MKMKCFHYPQSFTLIKLNVVEYLGCCLDANLKAFRQPGQNILTLS